MEAAKKDILERLSERVGSEVTESSLSAPLRNSVNTLAHVERSLFAIKQIYYAELDNSQNFLSRFVSRRAKLGIERDREEVERLKAAVENKIEDISKRILSKSTLRENAAVPAADRSSTDATQYVSLKCPNCGAGLPIPSTEFVKCDYCGSTLTMQNLQIQLSSILQRI